MNFSAFLQGKKTYICAAMGLLYLAGAGAGLWQFDSHVLMALGFGGMAALRAAIGKMTGADLETEAPAAQIPNAKSQIPTDRPPRPIVSESAPAGASLPSMMVIGWLGLLGLSLMVFIGCKATLEPGGAYAPARVTLSTNADGTLANAVMADKGLYLVDASFDLAYQTAQTVFETERKNRAFLQSLSPDIKKTLDQLRPQVVLAVKKFAVARTAYQQSPTPAGLSSLQTILSELQQISAAAQAVAIPQDANN